jgi:DNA-binding NarL/FixJ family response regulator
MTKRLLIVEDYLDLLRAIAVCLRQAGFDVLTARSGEEAILRLAETIPDLVVSDIMMPDMDGYALAEQIRSNPRTDLIPIIFLTAKDTPQDRIAGFRVGVDAYLVKPFEPEELVAVIQSILARIKRTHIRVARRSPTSNDGATNTESHVKSAAADGAAKTPDEDLTEAELRIAHAVARGLSNKEIAQELGISSRTVEMHISHILAKKSWSNRVEIARFVIAREFAE